MITPEYDVRRGHAIVRDEDGTVAAELVNLDSQVGIDLPNGTLTPDTARALGHALVSWSAWKRHITPTIDHYQRTGGL